MRHIKQRAEHRRELRHGLQKKGNNYKGTKNNGHKVKKVSISFGRPKRWSGHCDQCLRRFLMEGGGRPHGPDLCKKTQQALAARPEWVKKTFSGGRHLGDYNRVVCV